MKNNKIINLIYVAIFFVIIIIPMLHISNEKFSKEENRALATWKPLYSNSSGWNYNFGNDYDKWFSDRYTYRDFYINLYSKLVLPLDNIYRKKGSFWNKNNNWMFGQFENKLISPMEEKLLVKNIKHFNQFCRKNNIKLYIIIVPIKFDIYYQYAYPYKQNKQNLKAIQKIITNLAEQTEVPIIYPYNQFKKMSKNNLIYFKTDHHWTDYGAAITYEMLINKIRQDFNNIHAFKDSDYNTFYSNKVRSDWERDFHSGRTYEFLGLNYSGEKLDKILDQKYLYYDNKNEKLLRTLYFEDSFYKTKTFVFPLGADLKALLIGTSNSENLMQFFPYYFKNSKYLRINYIEGLPIKEQKNIIHLSENLIKNYKPRIIILCLSASNIQEIAQSLKDMQYE